MLLESADLILFVRGWLRCGVTLSPEGLCSNGVLVYLWCEENDSGFSQVCICCNKHLWRPYTCKMLCSWWNLAHIYQLSSTTNELCDLGEEMPNLSWTSVSSAVKQEWSYCSAACLVPGWKSHLLYLWKAETCHICISSDEPLWVWGRVSGRCVGNF